MRRIAIALAGMFAATACQASDDEAAEGLSDDGTMMTTQPSSEGASDTEDEDDDSAAASMYATQIADCETMASPDPRCAIRLAAAAACRKEAECCERQFSLTPKLCLDRTISNFDFVSFYLPRAIEAGATVWQPEQFLACVSSASVCDSPANPVECVDAHLIGQVALGGACTGDYDCVEGATCYTAGATEASAGGTCAPLAGPAQTCDSQADCAAGVCSFIDYICDEGPFRQNGEMCSSSRQCQSRHCDRGGTRTCAETVAFCNQ